MSATALAPWMAAWRLEPDGAPFVTDWGSHLAPVRFEGAPAMLKIAGSEEERRGAALMAWFAGEGAARILAMDGPALLLERVVGEQSLIAMAREGADAEATRILCRAVARLHTPRASPPPPSLVPLDAWFSAVAPAAARHGGVLLASRDAAASLLAAPRDVRPLHGDIHHGNVLDGGPRGWLAIDPKGLLGERGFDYANLLGNPDIATAGAPGVLMARAFIVAEEAGFELRRLLTWVLAWAGLSAARMLDLGKDAGPALTLAGLARDALRDL